MNENSKIYIAGHRGLVGSAIVKNLESKGYANLIYRTHKELDLCSQNSRVRDLLLAEKFCSDSMFVACIEKSGFVRPVKLVTQGHKKKMDWLVL